MRSNKIMRIVLASILSGASVLAQSNAPGWVLSEQKISDLSGGFPGGLADGDHFGTTVVSIGDLDDDGYMDIAVGSPDDDDGGGNSGAVWILFLDEDSNVLSSVKISAATAQLAGVIQQGDSFGTALASLPDLDGDGIPELAVGAPGDDTGGTDRGAIYVLGLDPAGGLQGYTKIADATGGFGMTLEDDDRLGGSLAALEDLDLDGLPELVAGCKLDDDGGTSRGAVYILFMGASGSTVAQAKVSDTSGGFTAQLANFDQFGNSVAGIGDLNGDGRCEVAVGAFGDDSGGLSAGGAVYILFLRADGTVQSHSKIASGLANFGGTICNGDGFGNAVGALGDITGDEIPDLAVGMLRDLAGVGSQRGAMWVIYLDPQGECLGQVKIAPGVGNFGGLLLDGDHFGSAADSFVSFANLVMDGSLEAGAMGGVWTEKSTNFGSPLCSEAVCGLGGGGGPRNGEWWAWFGGAPGVKEVSSIEQDVMVNSDKLSFHLYIPVASGNGSDFVRVRMDGDILFAAKEDESQYYAGYTLVEVDISEYNDSDMHTLKIESTCDSDPPPLGNSEFSNFFIDDIFISDVVGMLPMLVGSPGDDDGGIDRGAVWVINLAGITLAAAVSRNGAGTNLELFTASNRPVVGGTWSALIEPLGFPNTLVVAFLDPLAGVMTNFGELLVDPFSTELGSNIETGPANRPHEHDLPVPNLTELVGFTLSTQGLRFGPPMGVDLLNAIDLTIGR